MACLRGLHDNFRGLFIANLAHHDDIGILAEYGPEAAHKCQARLGIDMHLVYAWEHILDGIFYRDDIDRSLAQFVEQSAKRPALAGARRAWPPNHTSAR